MKTKNKRLNFVFIAAFTLLTVVTVNAQFLSGFAGKKTVIKTDLLKGNGFGLRNIDAEILLHQNFTFGIAYRKYANNNVRQITTSDPNFFNNFVQAKRGSVDFSIIEFTARYYFTTSLVPAPHGFYVFLSHGRGSGTVKGNLHNSAFSGGMGGATLQNNPYNFKNVDFRNFQIGIGKQKVLNNYFTIDYGCSIGRNKLINNKNKATLSGIAPFVGEHFMSNSFLRIDEAPNVVSTFDNKNQYQYNGEPSMRNIAFFFYVKLGIMIF
jgi:hypothetical protein